MGEDGVDYMDEAARLAKEEVEPPAETSGAAAASGTKEVVADNKVDAEVTKAIEAKTEDNAGANKVGGAVAAVEPVLRAQEPVLGVVAQPR